MFKLFGKKFIVSSLIIFITFSMIACGSGSGSKTQTTPGPGPGPDPKSIAGDYVGNSTETRSAADKIVIKAEPLPETVPAVIHIEENGGVIEGGLLSPDGLFFFEGTFDEATGAFVITAEDEEDTFEGDGTYNSETKCITGAYSYIDKGSLVEGEFEFCQDENSISNTYCLSFQSYKDTSDKGTMLAGLLVFNSEGISDSGWAILAFEDDEGDVIFNHGTFQGNTLDVEGMEAEFFAAYASGVFSGTYDAADSDYGVFALSRECVDPETIEPTGYTIDWSMPLRYRIRSNDTTVEKQIIFGIRGLNGDVLSASELESKVKSFKLFWPDGTFVKIDTINAGDDKSLGCEVIPNGENEYKLNCLDEREILASDVSFNLNWYVDSYVAEKLCSNHWDFSGDDCDTFKATPAGSYALMIEMDNGQALIQVFDYPGDMELERLELSAEWAEEAPPITPSIVPQPTCGELLVSFHNNFGPDTDQMRLGMDLVYFIPETEFDQHWVPVFLIKIPNNYFADMVNNDKPLRIDGYTVNGIDAELRPEGYSQPFGVNFHTQARYYDDGFNFARRYADTWLVGWTPDCD